MDDINLFNGYGDPLQVDVDDFEPVARNRCNTWPLRRPDDDGELSTHTSPLIHEEIPEEGSSELLALTADLGSSNHGPSLFQHSPCSFSTGSHSPDGLNSAGDDSCISPNNDTATGKKNSSRRNAWGNMSYADLITQAVLSSPEKRLTLSQIYDWMVQNVPYFRDKGDSNSSAGWKPLPRINEECIREGEGIGPLQDPLLDSTSSSPSQGKKRPKKSGDGTQPKKPNPWGPQSYADLIFEALNSAQEGKLKLADIYEWFAHNLPYFNERKSSEASAGWKNSIRHNLSLHSRFMRIQNEGAGKSSWWVINPDAKPGKASRRPRANTLEAKSLVKKRARVNRKIEAQRALGSVTPDTVSSLPVSEASSFTDDFFSPNGGGLTDFRQRSDSNLSNYSLASINNRLSPTMECDWMPCPMTAADPPVDLLEIDSIRLDALTQSTSVDRKPPPPYREPHSQALASMINGHNHSSPIKMEPQQSCSAQATQTSRFGNNFAGGKSDPPAYTELYPVTSSTQVHGNPMLRDALLQQKQRNSSSQNPPNYYSNQSHMLNPYGAPNQTYNSCGGTRLTHCIRSAPELAPDISDICLESTAKQDLQCDVDAVLRHELSAGNGTLDFSSFL